MIRLGTFRIYFKYTYLIGLYLFLRVRIVGNNKYNLKYQNQITHILNRIQQLAQISFKQCLVNIKDKENTLIQRIIAKKSLNLILQVVPTLKKAS